jgi:hypothetical protein
MPFRPLLEQTQIRPAPRFRHPRSRGRNNPLKNGSHKESF